jgi:uncharacterized membrane protein YhaH (DUF805 family)
MRSTYGANRVSIRLAFRPFIDAFVFQGRSTRSEVASFWLLGMIVTAFRLSVDNPSVGVRIAGLIWTLVWSWPWIPLFVRRLHDQDRTGRWAWLSGVLVLVAVAGLWIAPAGNGPGISVDLTFFRASRQIAWTPVTIAMTIATAAVIFAILVLFILRGTSGANRYGPDPRLDQDRPLIPAET